MAKEMTTVLLTPPDQMPRLDVSQIPDYVAENFAQAVYESIRRVYNDPKVQADFRRWKAEQAQQQMESGVTTT